MQLFDPQSANAKVIVLFTDGKTTAGPPPAPVAAAARAEGIILYCIGLIGSDGIDVSVLNDWATDPDASHVAVTPDAADLEDLFRDLAANISKTGATDIVIDEVVSADFQIASMSPPTTGTAEMQSSTALQWKIPELGVTANEGASLQFVIQHNGQHRGPEARQRVPDLFRQRGQCRGLPHALGGGGLRNGCAGALPRAGGLLDRGLRRLCGL